MHYLFHLSTVPKYLNWFDNDWEKIQLFAQKHHMDGIEIMVHNDYDINKVPPNFAYGMHLKFWPVWIDFWNGNKEALKESIGGPKEIEELYGGQDPSCLIELYKSQYRIAKELKVKYMVFHVSHVLCEDTFRWEYEYTDKDVMKATIELVNAAFPNELDGPMLLFENLWWPGLTYCNPELTQWFIEQINYPNKGYLLDTSHLILTNPNIWNEKEAVSYMRDIVSKLGSTRSYIKAMHVNKSLPKNYMRQNHLYKLESYQKASNPGQKMGILKRHIGNLDWHIPFDHPIIQELINDISPEYCVFEVNPSEKSELAHYLNQQNRALGRIPNK